MKVFVNTVFCILLCSLLYAQKKDVLIVGSYDQERNSVELVMEKQLQGIFDLSSTAQFGELEFVVAPDRSGILLMWDVRKDKGNVNNVGVLIPLDNDDILYLQGPGVKIKYTYKCIGVGCNACDAGLTWDGWKPVVSCRCVGMVTEDGYCNHEVTLEFEGGF